jgi:hypothetical protein
MNAVVVNYKNWQCFVVYNLYRGTHYYSQLLLSCSYTDYVAGLCAWIVVALKD